MKLPEELVREFAATTNDKVEKPKESTCYGVVHYQGDVGYVRLDGADALTPAIFAVSVHDGDRVLVTLKGRKALVTANITYPTLTVGTLKSEVGIIVEGYLTTNEKRTYFKDKVNKGLTFSHGGIGAYGSDSSYWYMTNDGELFANSATITGNITATSLALSPNAAISGLDYSKIADKPDLTVYIAKDGEIGTVADGSDGFKVSSAGLLTASNAIIRGTIYASAGRIGGFEIASNAIKTVGLNVDSAADNSVAFSSVNFSRVVAGANRTNLRFAIGGNFAIANDGTIYTSAGVIGDCPIENGSLKVGVSNINGNIPTSKINNFSTAANDAVEAVYELSKLKPVAYSGSASDISGLATVATTGNLSDVTGSGTILYRGDVSISESTSNNITTTTFTYYDTAGNKVTRTAKTNASGKYVLLDIPKGVLPEDGATSSNTTGILIANDGLLKASNALIYGTVYAQDGVFNGTIYASAGHIGGWLLSDGIIYKQTAEVSTVGAYQYRTYLQAKAYNVTPSSSDAAFAIQRRTKAASGYGSWTDLFAVNYAGSMTATAGTIGGWTISSTILDKYTGALTVDNETYKFRAYMNAPTNPTTSTNAFAITRYDWDGTTATYKDPMIVMRYDGYFYAKNAEITGNITATSLTLANGVSVPYSSVSGTPNLGIYISIGSDGKITLPRNGSMGTLADGSSGLSISTAGLLQASNAVIYGTIYASAGKIGGWNISSTILEKYTDAVTIDGNQYKYRAYMYAPASPSVTTSVSNAFAVYRYDWDGSTTSNGEWIFLVRYDGALYAKNAHITGDITATSLTLSGSAAVPVGKVDGIDAYETTSAVNTKLSSYAKNNVTIQIDTNGNITLPRNGSVGTLADGSVGLSISTTGLLQASNAVIYGTIYASAGKIGGWNISSEMLQKYTPEVTTDGAYRYRIYLYAPTTPNTNGSNNAICVGRYKYVASTQTYEDIDPVFVVRYDGYLLAKNAHITGEVTATSGKIGNFTLTSTTASSGAKGALYSGSHSSMESANDGVFIGEDGISLGGGGKIQMTKTGTMAMGSDLLIRSSITPTASGTHTLSGISIANVLNGNSTELGYVKANYVNSVPVFGIGSRLSGATVEIDSEGGLILYSAGVMSLIADGGDERYSIKIRSSVSSERSLFMIGAAGGTPSSPEDDGQIIFGEGEGQSAKKIAFAFSANTSYQSPASITMIGSQGGEYFIAPNIKATSSLVSNGTAWLKGSTYIQSAATKGTTPTGSAAYREIIWYGAGSSNTAGANRLAVISQSYATSGSTNLQFVVYKPEAGSTASTYFMITYPASGDPSATLNCAFTVNGTLKCTTYSGSTGIVVVGSTSTDGQRVSSVKCNSATEFGIYGQWATTGSTYTHKYVTVTTSDIRLKKDVHLSTAKSLDLINHIPVAEFTWKENGEHWDAGFIAQDLVKVDPRLAHIRTAPDDYSSIDTFYMLGHIVKAIQELSAENKALKEKLETLAA